MALLNLGAPSLIGKAALAEGMSVLKADFPLTVWIKNQTLDSVGVAGVDLPYNTLSEVTFDTAEAMHAWARKANQIGLLHGFEDAFVVYDEKPEDDEVEAETDDEVEGTETVTKKKPGRPPKATTETVEGGSNGEQ